MYPFNFVDSHRTSRRYASAGPSISDISRIDRCELRMVGGRSDAWRDASLAPFGAGGWYLMGADRVGHLSRGLRANV